ncbi:hypothetical protein JXA88_15915 [Candidatus Fermentibacteria bacterium]|nr:hypothetical protein [Candidatus Fermentibacteria bacterium]
MRRDHLLIHAFGIALVAMATLLLETSLMRVFSVLFANHFAFLIISTALLGFSAAGAVLPALKWLDRYPLATVLAWTSLIYGGAIAVALLLVILVPLQLLLILENPTQIAPLLLYYLFLSVPFFFGGLTVSFLLSRRTGRVNQLYFADLVGAAIGCVLVLPLLPLFGGSGSVLAASLLAAVAALSFSMGAGWRTRGLAILAVITAGVLMSLGTTKLEVPLKEEKRRFAHDDRLGRIEYTKWSAISRIDVAPRWPTGKTIWIDAGSNESVMVPFDGDFEILGPDTTYRGLPYLLRPDAKALVIGPSGGREVLAALANGAAHVDAVELDPTIVRIVTNEYRDYIGDIFNHPRVNLVVDEGRSFLRRSGTQYDVIQQINNFTPVALASGALNLSETYLTTVEAFVDYLDHLTPDGLLSIYRWGELRLVSVALAALERIGISEPWRHMAILDGQGWSVRQFYLRRTPFPQAEMDSLKAYGNHHGFEVLYLPDGTGSDSLLAALAHSAPEERPGFYKRAGFNLYPSTDNRPFFDHFQKFGRFTAQASMLPEDFKPLLTYYNIADLTLLAVLAEALLLSLVFIVLPNWILNRRGLRVPGKGLALTYFACLGLGFILLELAAMQRFTLFIGSPMYAITTVLFSMLLTAGIGSFLARKASTHPVRTIRHVVPLIVILLGIQVVVSGTVFRAFMASSLPVRALVSFLMLAPLGLAMGAPFPLGLRSLAENGRALVPWMWATNGYFTVIGSVLAVIIALNIGFTAVFTVSALCYATAFFAAAGLAQIRGDQ